jgi:hypothetical protein
MRRFPWVTPIFAALLCQAAAFAQTGFPFQDESLRYSVNWPSGLSLGEASFAAHRTAGGWNLDMGIEAGVPGFGVGDKFQSSASADLCSAVFQRDTSHGSRKSREKTTFDQAAGVAHRVTEFPAGGGQSDLSIGSCAHDALAFLYYSRRELGQGRVPPAQQVYFGSAYSVRLEYTGAQSISIGEGRPEVTDRLVVSAKGPRSDFSFEVFFARDAARTPLLVKIPFSVGTISMELVR